MTSHNAEQSKTAKDMIDAKYDALMFKTLAGEEITGISFQTKKVTFYKPVEVKEDRLNTLVMKFDELANNSLLESSTKSYKAAALAAYGLKTALEAAKEKLDQKFKDLEAKKNQVLRPIKGAPKLTEESIINDFQAACKNAEDKYMPQIEANHSIVNDLYAFFTWVATFVFEDAEEYKSTRSVAQELKDEYEKVVPTNEGQDPDEETHLKGGSSGYGSGDK
jgi:hypothetical protein